MSENPYALEGKLVLVTGSGVGIGQEVGVEAARRGADVVLHYASSARGAEEAVEQITSLGRRATAIQADLGQVDECRRLVDEAARFLGGIDGLVSNAGVTLVEDFLNTTEEQFTRIYNINIRGQYFCAQQAVKYMLERGHAWQERNPDRWWPGASIINMSSCQGFSAIEGHSVYAGTKGAINSFTRVLALELCDLHIRANAIAPDQSRCRATIGCCRATHERSATPCSPGTGSGFLLTWRTWPSFCCRTPRSSSPDRRSTRTAG